MYSSENFDKLCFLYKLEGQPKNLSIESFCLQQGVPYQLFNKCFSSRKKSIVPVDIVGILEKDHWRKHLIVLFLIARIRNLRSPWKRL